MPVAILVFFLECDLSRLNSSWKVAGVFLIGGVISLVFTHLFEISMPGAAVGEFFSFLGAPAASAGITEEPAKALPLLFFMRNRSRYPYILNGILLGAAIGAGFAAFETAGYIFESLFDETGLGCVWTALVRGALAPFMHIAWTAAIGGALWMGAGTKGTVADGIQTKGFVFTFVLSVVLHVLWNSPYASYWWLGMIAWLPLCYYLRKGVEQLAMEEASS